jgi:hypothetical protein
MRALAAILFLLLSGKALAGYDVHVTRHRHWYDVNGPKISLGDWQRYAKSDPDVSSDAGDSKFFVIRVSGQGVPLLYDRRHGELVVKDPSQAAISKLVQIAQCLHARVQGDDGEFYPTPP